MLKHGSVTKAKVHEKKRAKKKYHHVTPMVIENDETISLYFDSTAVQSTMLLDDPYVLTLGYTRTMMGFLLFNSNPRRISMIGLGGGSLAKYCYRHLPDTEIVVIEINPEVIALRDRFSIPTDDQRFQILCDDAAHYVKVKSQRPDVLIVDGYDVDGLPEELGSRAFYQACYRHLSDDGMLVMNLITDDPDFHRYLSALRGIFADAITLVPSEDSDSNVTVFAWKGAQRLPSLADMLDRAHTLASGHTVNLHATATRIEYGKRFNWKRYDQR